MSLTRTNVHVKIFLERGRSMENILRKYGIIILLYLVIVGGIILLNERIKLLNQNNEIQTNYVTK